MAASGQHRAALDLSRELLRDLPDALRAEGVPQDVIDRAVARVLSTGDTLSRLARITSNVGSL